MADERIRVLVVDDAAIYRKIISDVLAEMPDVEVVGRAANGEIALEQIKRLRPHIVTLDVEMPVMDGLETLRRLRSMSVETGVIMLSSQTDHGARATVTALELGALDFVPKPHGNSLDENIRELRESLGTRVRSLGRVQRIRTKTGNARAEPAGVATVKSPRSTAAPAKPVRRSATPPKIIAVGVSTGGPQALQRFLPEFPADLPIPIVIVQHMPPVFTKSLAEDLDRRSALAVCEAENRQLLLPGHAYVAPGGKQMKLDRDAGRLCLAVNDDPPENSCRPSVDYLFRSVGEFYPGKTLAVIMTGMGNDGSEGCRLIHQRGGTIFAQDESSCVVFGMPRLPIEEGLAEVTGSPEQLVTEIVQLLHRRELVCR